MSHVGKLNNNKHLKHRDDNQASDSLLKKCSHIIQYTIFSATDATSSDEIAKDFVSCILSPLSQREQLAGN